MPLYGVLDHYGDSTITGDTPYYGAYYGAWGRTRTVQLE